METIKITLQISRIKEISHCESNTTHENRFFNLFLTQVIWHWETFMWKYNLAASLLLWCYIGMQWGDGDTDNCLHALNVFLNSFFESFIYYFQIFYFFVLLSSLLLINSPLFSFSFLLPTQESADYQIRWSGASVTYHN